jgi:hypothetical protein
MVTWVHISGGDAIDFREDGGAKRLVPPDLNQMITLSVITLISFHRILLTYLDNFRLTVMLLTTTITPSHCKGNYFNYLRLTAA